MRMITFAGGASCGKTSVVLRYAAQLRNQGLKLAAVKFDCAAGKDGEFYKKAGIPVVTGLSGNLCPDHFFVSHIQDSWSWAERRGADVLLVESAGLCNRCSPHIKDVPGVCVIDNLSGINAPYKIGPMLRTADVVVITKGDVVSQAEREVFAFRVRQANSRAAIVAVNGLTGQGAFALVRRLESFPAPDNPDGLKLRYTMPAALCSYCLGERKVGTDYQIGMVKGMNFDDEGAGDGPQPA